MGRSDALRSSVRRECCSKKKQRRNKNWLEFNVNPIEKVKDNELLLCTKLIPVKKQQQKNSTIQTERRANTREGEKKRCKNNNDTKLLSFGEVKKDKW